MQNYTVTLPGARTVDGRLSGRTVGDLLHAIADGAAGALRLRVEGRSATRTDRLPSWLEAGTEFALVDVTRDEPGVVLSAPSLADAVPKRFEQRDLFSPIDPHQSVLTVLLESLSQAASGRAESDAFDVDLLNVLSRDITRVFKHSHAESLHVRNGSPRTPTVTFDAGGLRHLIDLRDRTPKPRRVRVAGQIDEIRYSTSSFLMRLPDGTAMRGVLVEPDPERLRRHYGGMALVEGTAQFRPTGSLLRVDVESIEPAVERDLVIFGGEPRPLSVSTDRPRKPRHQSAKSGINAVIGQWPGDETDEEIEQLLREIS